MMDGNIILSVAKAMEVLQILSQAESPLSLKELATRCGYPKSTVFGLLTTMRAYDVAAQTPDGNTRWVCGCSNMDVRWNGPGTSLWWPAPIWSTCASGPERPSCSRCARAAA